MAVAQGNERIKRSVDGIAQAERGAERAAKGRVAAQRGGGSVHGAGGGHGGIFGAVRAGAGRGFGGHLFQGAGHIASLSGPMLAVGAAALAVSVGLHAMEAASERQVKAAMEEAKARHELSEKIKGAVRAADTTAVGTFKSNEDALRSLAGMKNGDGLVMQAKDYAGSMGPDAIKAFAMLSSHGMGDKMGAASAAAGTGQIGLLEAVQTMVSGKVGVTGGANRVAAGILSEYLNRGYSEGDVESMRANYARSQLGNRISAYDAGEGKNTAAAIGRFQTSSTLFAHQREEFDKVANPESFAREEATKEINAQLRILSAGSEAEWAVVGLLKDIKSLFGGGEGSMASRYNETARLLPTE